MPEFNRAENPGDNENRKAEELKESFTLSLTNEEGMLLLTSVRLLDKLVAGVTIHAQERDQLIKEIIAKLDKKVPEDVSRVAAELADAIVDSVICEGELEDDYGFLSDSIPMGIGDEDFRALRRDIAEEIMNDERLAESPELLQRDLSGAGGFSVQKFARDLDFDQTVFDYPMYNTDKTLPVLEQALINHHSVKAHYYSILREAVDTVTLDPLVILKEHSLWRMVAYCHERRDILVFRVDRIKDIGETKTSFKAPADVSNLSYSRLPAYS